MASPAEEFLSELPDTRRYSEALERIGERQPRRPIANGQVTAPLDEQPAGLG